MPIDIIIPVYKGFTETQHCIESVLNNPQKTAYELIVINDCSPEPELVNYLEKLSSTHAITLLHNMQNVGFVKTVNRGMQLHPERDVILLNSDTRVFHHWLDRLINAASLDEKIGTVTPFSNNATICSYPDFPQGSDLPSQLSPESLDLLFSQIHTNLILDIPTAVGFCMLIKRACLSQVGLFDEERFGKGYGEENDFSLRAQKKGWRNVICLDTFVYHAGSVSFGEEKKALIENNLKLLNQSHPDYSKKVRQFVSTDPLKPFRDKITLYRLGTSPLPTILSLSHASGGGTEKHITDLSHFLENKANFLLLKKQWSTIYVLHYINPFEKLNLLFSLPQDYSRLMDILTLIGIDRLHFHHVLDVDPCLLKLNTDLRIPYDFTVHDYYSYCPQINLIDKNYRYCGEPDLKGCEICLKGRPVRGISRVKTWREENNVFLTQAARVFVPAVSVEARIRKHFPNANLIFAAHPDVETSVLNLPPHPIHLDTHEPLRILLIGTVSETKGILVLKKTLESVRQKNLPIEFHLLGNVSPRVIRPDNVYHLYGKYTQAEIGTLIKKIKPHLAWFPAQWPETYSYTLSEALEAQLPVVVTDLGAPPERIAGRPWSWIMPWDTSPETWAEFFMALTTQPPVSHTALAPHSTFTYRQDYLVATKKKSRIPDMTLYKDTPPLAACSFLKRTVIALSQSDFLIRLTKKLLPIALIRKLKIYLFEKGHL